MVVHKATTGLWRVEDLIVHYRVHKSLTLVPILSPMNPFQTCNFNITSFFFLWTLIKEVWTTSVEHNTLYILSHSVSQLCTVYIYSSRWANRKWKSAVFCMWLMICRTVYLVWCKYYGECLQRHWRWYWNCPQWLHTDVHFAKNSIQLPLHQINRTQWRSHFTSSYGIRFCIIWCMKWKNVAVLLHVVARHWESRRATTRRDRWKMNRDICVVCLEDLHWYFKW